MRFKSLGKNQVLSKINASNDHNDHKLTKLYYAHLNQNLKVPAISHPIPEKEVIEISSVCWRNWSALRPTLSWDINSQCGLHFNVCRVAETTWAIITRQIQYNIVTPPTKCPAASKNTDPPETISLESTGSFSFCAFCDWRWRRKKERTEKKKVRYRFHHHP